MKLFARNRFLKLSGLSAAALVLDPSLLFGKTENKITVGLCGYLEKSPFAKEAGCDYIEEGTAKILMPTKGDDEFNKVFDKLPAQPLKIICFYDFIPGELKSVCDHAQHENII